VALKLFHIFWVTINSSDIIIISIIIVLWRTNRKLHQKTRLHLVANLYVIGKAVKRFLPLSVAGKHSVRFAMDKANSVLTVKNTTKFHQ
jgi:hypothetical protein